MDLKKDLKDHIGPELQGPLGPSVEQKQDVSGMSIASSKETTQHVSLSTCPNTSTPIGKLWVEIYSRARRKEMLNSSFQGQKIQSA